MKNSVKKSYSFNYNNPSFLGADRLWADVKSLFVGNNNDIIIDNEHDGI